ncbi:MAG: pyridoxamine 5'-phosphate oxidase family protein [Gemmatimonadota bacterium]
MSGGRDEYPMRTDRSRVRRSPQRAAYDFATIAAILDDGMVCHLGTAVGGQPVVVPVNYGRRDREILVHGSPASRSFRALAEGAPWCCTVTLLDGLVLARSAFHHSMNYRSVVLFGTARIVEDSRKEDALRVISEHLLPGRWAEVRPPSPQELKATLVLSLPIDEGSAKVRTGPPVDDEADYQLSCWAGVLPVALRAGAPEADGRMRPGIPVPAYAQRWRAG